MTTILVSISAKNIHKPPAVWQLKAYCESKGQEGIAVMEYNVNQDIGKIAESLCKLRPDIVGFSCYIWNIRIVEKLAGMIRVRFSGVFIVLGGPEVSYSPGGEYPFADRVISGAGERAFYELLMEFKSLPVSITENSYPAFAELPTPYTEGYFSSFKDEQISDISHRLIYYESSRGCPFSCAYCLSSADEEVQYLPLERVKNELGLLINRGALCIKFTDRTFNADKARALAILKFIKDLDTRAVFHFEAAADLFDGDYFALLRQMPKGRVQFEIGIQSVNEKTLLAVSRKADTARALANITGLSRLETCRVHVDLIAGLPHETLETFARAIDACIYAKSGILQLGFLKLLKGTRLRTGAESFGTDFSDSPPYEVLNTDTMSREDFLLLKRLERIINKFYNGGIFQSAIAYGIDLYGSPYTFFSGLAQFMEDKGLTVHPLKTCYTALLDFLSLRGDRICVSELIKQDCLSYDRRSLPDSLRKPYSGKPSLKSRRKFS